MSQPAVLMDTKYHNEIELLQNDAVLIKMYQNVPSHIDLNQIPYSVVNSQYKKFGGTHDALRIGSLKDALLKMRLKVTVVSYETKTEVASKLNSLYGVK